MMADSHDEFLPWTQPTVSMELTTLVVLYIYRTCMYSYVTYIRSNLRYISHST